MNGLDMGGPTIISLGYEYATEYDAMGKAQGGFAEARRRARMTHLIAAMTGRSADLQSWEELEENAQIMGEHYRGIYPVPVSEITGTVNRLHDFDSKFHPTQEYTRSRW